MTTPTNPAPYGALNWAPNTSWTIGSIFISPRTNDFRRVTRAYSSGATYTDLDRQNTAVYDPTAFNTQIPNATAQSTEGMAWNTGRAIGRLFLVGHSLIAGGGAPLMESAWHNLLDGLFQAESVNYAKGGAVAAWNESNTLPYGAVGDGGIGHVLSHAPFPPLFRPYKGVWSGATTYALNDVVWTGADLDHLTWWMSQLDSNLNHNPVGDNGTNWQQISLTNQYGHTFHPSSRLSLVDFGSNDLGWHGDLNAFLNSMRVILSSMLASEITVRATDLKCTYTGAWAAATALGAGTGFCAGVTSGTRQLVANTSDTEDIIVPADWPGGYITANYVCTTQLTAGTFQVTVDGAVVLTKNAATDHCGTTTAGKTGGFGLRFQTTSGYHHIQIKQTVAIAGASVFTDALILEANPSPPVIVVGLHKFLDAATYVTAYTASTTASDANVDVWNTAIQNMISNEFATCFFMNPTDSISKDPTLFSYDKIHPNGRGAALLAAQTRDLTMGTVLPSLSREMATKLCRPPKVGRRTRLDFSTDNASNSISITTGAGWTDLTYTASLAGFTSGSRTIEGSISADVGDMIEIGIIGVWSNDATATGNVDVVTIAFPNGISQAGVRTNYVSSGGPTQASNGLPTGSSLNAGTFAPILTGGPVYYKVRPEDLLLGEITLRVIVKSTTATRTFLASSANPFILNLANVGQAQYYNGQRAAR